MTALMLGLLGAAGAVIVANGLTTWRLWSSPAFDRPQKVAQTALVWLLPGSFVLVRHMLADHRPVRRGDSISGEGGGGQIEDHVPDRDHSPGSGHDSGWHGGGAD